MSIVNTLALESNRQIKINFDGGDLSSDAGLLLIKEFVSKLGIDKLFSHSFKTNDSASFRYHTDKENLLQMIYMIIAGYFEDFSYDASKSYLINGKRKNKWWLLYQFENGKVQIDKKIGKNKDVISYEEKLLNIEFSNYVEDAKGEVNRHWNKEDYAYVCFKMRGTTEQTVGLIEKRCGKPIDISNYTVPAYQNNAIAKEMNDKSIKEVFYVFVEGKKAKTRSIDIYVTEDKDGMVYVYIFG